MLGGGALLLNWIFGEEEYDLGENINNKFRPPRPATTRKKKKRPLTCLSRFSLLCRG